MSMLISPTGRHFRCEIDAFVPPDTQNLQVIDTKNLSDRFYDVTHSSYLTEQTKSKTTILLHENHGKKFSHVQ